MRTRLADGQLHDTTAVFVVYVCVLRVARARVRRLESLHHKPLRRVIVVAPHPHAVVASAAVSMRVLGCVCVCVYVGCYSFSPIHTHSIYIIEYRLLLVPRRVAETRAIFESFTRTREDRVHTRERDARTRTVCRTSLMIYYLCSCINIFSPASARRTSLC